MHIDGKVRTEYLIFGKVGNRTAEIEFQDIPDERTVGVVACHVAANIGTANEKAATILAKFRQFAL
jgi:hypothetical protein